MTIRYLGDAIYKTNVAGERPTNPIANALIIETDTRKTYYYQSGTWTEETAGTGAIGSLPSTDSTYTIYIAGSIVKARNNRTGVVDYSNSNDPTTGNAVLPINSAINNIKTLDGIDTAMGAAIFIMAGHYNCKTQITASAETSEAQRHAISLRGEGKGTLLHWTPSSTITNGILLKCNHAQLRDVMIWANDKVVNLVRGEGPTATSGQYNWGTVENVIFLGPNTNIPTGGANKILNNMPVIANQTGLNVFTDGAETSPSTATSYFAANWKVHNCEFGALDYGAKFIGRYADMCNHSNIHIGSCETGYYLEGTQHNLSNFRIESNSQSSTIPVGHYGIYLRALGGAAEGGANITFLSNINGELRWPGARLIHIEAGVNNCIFRNTINSGANEIDNFRMWDENIVGVNFDYDSKYTPTSPEQTVRRVGFITGMNQGITLVSPNPAGIFTNGFGECSFPNVRENLTGTGTTPPSITTAFDGNDQFSKKLSTGGGTGAVDNRASLQYVQAFHNRSSNMRIQGRIRTAHNANIRIFIGLINQNADPTATTPFIAPAATTDILAGINGVGLWVDSGATTQWRVIHNDGTAGASVKDTIVGDPVIDTTSAYHKFEIVTEDAANRFGVRYDNKMNIVTSRIPATTARLGWLVFIQATTTAVRDLYLQHLNMVVTR